MLLAAEDAKSGDKGRGREGSRTDTGVDECRNEMINRVRIGIGSTSP